MKEKDKYYEYQRDDGVWVCVIDLSDEFKQWREN